MHYHGPTPCERSSIQNVAKELNIDPAFDIASKVRIFNDSEYKCRCMNLIDNEFIYIPQSKTHNAKQLKEALAHGISHYYLDDRSNQLHTSSSIIPAISTIPAAQNLWNNSKQLNTISYIVSILMILNGVITPIESIHTQENHTLEKELRASENAKAFITNGEAFPFLSKKQTTEAAPTSYSKTTIESSISIQSTKTN